MSGEPAAVFVYGTFLPGHVRWPVLEPFAASWVPAVAQGALWDTGAGYPAALFGAGGRIPGVVVRLISEAAAAAVGVLDAVEGEGRLYRRVEVETSAGRAAAYEWLGSTDGFRSLPTGWHGARRS